MALTHTTTPDDVRAINGHPEFADTGLPITTDQVEQWIEQRIAQVWAKLASKGVTVPLEDDADASIFFWGYMKNAVANGAAHDLEVSPKAVTAAQLQASAETYLRQFESFLAFLDSLAPGQLIALGLEIVGFVVTTIVAGSGFETVGSDRVEGDGRDWTYFMPVRDDASRW